VLLDCWPWRWRRYDLWKRR